MVAWHIVSTACCIVASRQEPGQARTRAGGKANEDKGEGEDAHR